MTYMESPKRADTLPERIASDHNLCLRHRKGDRKASDTLVRTHHPMTVAIAKCYTRHGIPIEDLIQCGHIGILRAAKNYDPALGAFTTHSINNIKAMIGREIEEFARTIRIPSNAFHERNRAKRKQRCNEPLTPSEQRAMERIAASEVISFDEPDTDDRPRLHITSIPSNLPSPDAGLETRDNARDAEFLLKAIANKTHREIVRILFGFADGNQYTLQEVGDMFGLSRERVRQIKEKSIKTMKQVSHWMPGSKI